MNGAAFFPPEASQHAHDVDMLFFGLLAISVVIIALVLALCVTFAIRYRRGSSAPRGELPELFQHEIEIGWTVMTFFAFLFIFWWAAASFATALRTPDHAVEIHVVAKQWMWQIQHSNGAREIDEIHAPMGVPVKLVMTSQDVIHSLFLPALRLKEDVLPDVYTEQWFDADRTGTFNMLCSEFCGTGHSAMGGSIVIMPAQDYETWLAKAPQTADFAADGKSLFTRLGCSGCHDETAHVKAPSLVNLYNSLIKLSDGRTIQANEAYIRDSILLPRKDVVAGYDPIMPSYQGVADDGDVSRLVAYIKSLARGEGHDD